MPQKPMENINQFVSKYRYPERAKRDVLNALQHYRNLVPLLQPFVFNDGSTKELMCLDGTIPVPYRGVTYNIPIILWLLDVHPYSPPMCFVKPTADMQMKVSRHVDQSGRIYLPYLHEWNPNSSDLLGLIQVMIIVFGETPPVYSKPKAQDTMNYNNLPYPTQATGYMPLPATGSSLNYPYAPAVATPAYPPAPTSYPYPTGTNYPPTSTSSYAPVTTAPYPPYPPTSVATSVARPGPIGNTGTIGEEHIRASLLSAVEDKLRKRLREILSQCQAEMEVLRKTEDDLNKGKAQLETMIASLDNEQTELENSIQILKEKNDEMKDLVTKLENQDDLDIDEAVITTAPLYKQLLNAFAEESATEDAIYYLGEGLRKGIIDLDVFLKHVRELSRKQFMLRALMQKCRQKAGLPY